MDDEGGREGRGEEGLPFLLLSSPPSGSLTGGGGVLGLCLVTSAHCCPCAGQSVRLPWILYGCHSNHVSRAISVFI